MLSSWRALYVEFLPLLGAVSLCGAQTVSKTYSQAAARIGSGDFQTGCKLAQTAVREAPGASAYNLAGLCATHAGQVAEAERLFRKSLSFNDKFPDARINLATNLAQRGMLQQAVEEFRLILRYDPKHVTALYNLGRLEMASASWTEAATHLEQACVLAPKDAAIAVSLAEAWVKAGKQNSPDRRATAAMLSVARNAIAGREIQTASVLLAATEVLGEDNAEWNALRGYLAFRRGSPEEALPRLQRALELAPGREDYYMKIGELMLFHNSFQPAIAYFESGLRQLPQSALLQFGLAVSLMAGNLDSDRARQHLEKALSLRPDLVSAVSALFALCERTKDWPALAVAAERMLALNPNSHQGFYYKAVALDKQDGQLERVKDLLKKSIHLDPSFVDARVALGDVLLRERQVAAGIDELKSALRLKPDHVRAQYRLAMAYRELGQEESAREAFQKFQQLKAQQPSGWVSLFQLESGADRK